MHTFKYGGKDGKTYQLVEAKDLVVVRTEHDVELRQLSLSKSSRSLLQGIIPVAAFPEANVTVYRCVVTPENETGESLRNKIRRSLNQEDGIRFAGRVFKSAKTGTIFIYTENFFLKFKDEVKKGALRSHHKKCRSQNKRKTAFCSE